jgi:hypothetical protein
VQERAPLALDVLVKLFPALELGSEVTTIPIALMNVFEGLRATGRSAYMRCNAYMRNAPLRCRDDVGAEWMQLAPQALASRLSVSEGAAPGLAQRLDTYRLRAATHGAELERAWQEGATHRAVWDKLVAHATQHFSALHLGNFLRQLEGYTVAPGKHPMDQVLMDMRSRAAVALALCPDPADAPPTTSLRIIRAYGQALQWHLPGLVASLGLTEPDMVAAPEKWTLERIFSALERLGNTEHEFGELPAFVTGAQVVFDPKAVSTSGAAGGAPAGQHTRAGAAPAGKHRKGRFLVDVACADVPELVMTSMVMLATADAKGTAADMTDFGCYNCKLQAHQFFDCESAYAAANWDAAVTQRASIARWRPEDNASLRRLQKRIKEARAARRDEQGGRKPWGGRGRARGN